MYYVRIGLMLINPRLLSVQFAINQSGHIRKVGMQQLISNIWKEMRNARKVIQSDKKKPFSFTENMKSKSDELESSFIKHSSQPHISCDEYLRQLQVKLGESLQGLIRIYLDKRFWIIIRDVILGYRGDALSIELLTHLRSLV